MQSELLPCPFCRSEAIHQMDQPGIAWVGCDACHAEGPEKESLIEAIAAWNRRAPVGKESNV